MIVSELYIVGTPIGNLSDITFRAIETFKNVDVVAAEDTRRTLQLLNYFKINKPLVSVRAQNEKVVSKKIISFLDEGKIIAYVSDAGTPGISDPGSVLIQEVRKVGHKIIPIPGVSALTTIASVASQSTKTLIFEGFLSSKAGRRKKKLKELLESGNSFVIYESPFRITKTLFDISEIDPKRRVLVGREMTKIHEEFTEGISTEVFNYYNSKVKILGEFAVFVYGNKNVNFFDEFSDNVNEAGL